MNRPLQIGLLLFPDVTQLDLTGPWEVFARTPGVECHLIWKDRQPVRSDRGLSILPTTTFADCPPLDVICVPGGPGQIALMSDDVTLNFLRQQADQAKWVTSVCTGSLVLGAAGLLRDIVRPRTGAPSISWPYWARSRLVNGWCATAIVSAAQA